MRLTDDIADLVPTQVLARLRSAPQYDQLSTLAKIKAMRRAFRNWPIVVILIVLQVLVRKSAILQRIAGFCTDARVLLLTTTGIQVEVPVHDVLPAVEMFALSDYDLPNIVWATVRTVVDCGANVGAFTLWAAQKAECRVLAVEPNPRTFAILQRNVASLAGRVSVLNAAVAGSRGVRTLYDMSETSATSFFASSTAAVGTFEVTAVTMKDVLAHFSSVPIDLLKVDVEGAEYEVCRSCQSSDLERVRVALVECHQLGSAEMSSIAGKLAAAGMHVASEFRNGTELLLGWR